MRQSLNYLLRQNVEVLSAGFLHNLLELLIESLSALEFDAHKILRDDKSGLVLLLPLLLLGATWGFLAGFRPLANSNHWLELHLNVVVEELCQSLGSR